MASWKIEKTVPTLAVPTLEAGSRYYSRLGFTVEWRWPADESTHAGLARAYELAAELVDRPYGRREFSIVDPFGHLLTFSQDLGS